MIQFEEFRRFMRAIGQIDRDDIMVNAQKA
jgi:hypothetical protein